jgi:DNA-binding response OmpR family regulator
MTTQDTKKKILVVEDELNIEKMCQRILAGEGFDVDLASNGELARDMINRQRYDLFIFDIRMPVVSGKDLYQWLKNNHPQLADKVIFTSGDVMSGDTKDFLEEVNQPILLKPFDSNDLKDIISRVASSKSGE